MKTWSMEDGHAYPDQTGESLTVEFEGFTFTLELKPDDNPDATDWLGEFNPKTELRFMRTVGTRNGYVEIGTDGDNYDDDGTRAKYAEQDLDRLEAYAREEWSMVGAVVTVSRTIKTPRGTRPTSWTVHTVELGHASLWGIESNSGDEFFAATFDELTDEALKDARGTLAELAPDDTITIAEKDLFESLSLILDAEVDDPATRQTILDSLGDAFCNNL